MSALAAFGKETREYLRTSRLVILAAVLIFFGMTSPVLAKFTPQMVALIPGGEQLSGIIPEPTILDAVAQFIKNTVQFGVILALLLCMGAVASEVEKGTARLVLVKPLPRSSFILAKFAVSALAFLLVILAASLLAYYYTLFLFSAPPVGAWLGMTLLIWLYLLVFIAVTMLFSALFRSQAAAAGGAFGVLLVLGILGSIPAVGKYLPGALVDWSGMLFTGSASPAWTAVGVSVGIIVVCMIAAVVSFERRDL